MNIVRVIDVSSERPLDQVDFSGDYIDSFIRESSSYNPKQDKNKEILRFLIKELKRISEFNLKTKDLERYINSIKYYILEDSGEIDKAMNLKIEFYSRGGKYPYLPMVNLYSYLS